MSQKIPQYSDLTLVYQNVQDNFGQLIDLTLVDDIECVISKGDISSAPIVKLAYSTSPDNFVISSDNNTVSVKITSAQLGNSLGVFFTNLWIINGGKHLTHFTNNFVIVPTIPY